MLFDSMNNNIKLMMVGKFYQKIREDENNEKDSASFCSVFYVF